jgi:hypothetical protein
MNTKFLVGVAVAVGLFFLGVSAFKSPVVVSSPSLGAANVTAANALDQQSLVNELNLIANPLVAIGSDVSVSISFPAISTSTLMVSTTTVVTGGAGQLGDEVLVEPNTPTAGVQFAGEVTVASTTSATFQIVAFNASGAAVTPTSTTFNVMVLPYSTFKAPVGL